VPEIRAAILEGEIDRALKLMSLYYPTVLDENKMIYFKLKCRKFIEMIRRCNELSGGTSPSFPPRKSQDDYNGVFDHQMELDDQYSVGQNGTHNKWDDGTMDTSDDNGGTILENHLNHSELTERMISFGQSLKAEFDHDSRLEVKQMLEETFALIAYPDPMQSTLSHLLDEKERTPVAEELNGAILGMSNSRYAPLYMLTTNSEPRKIIILSSREAVRPNRSLTS
jgi:hypothetical protein